MNTLNMILLAFSLVWLQPVQKEEPDLTWTNIGAVYKTFDAIKPVLVNNKSQSLYLSRIYPNGYARLKRFNESSGEWELGEWSIACGTVADAIVPIEIKPQESHAIEVYWRVSMDDWNNPEFFVLSDHETKRRLNGRYKLLLRYALQPWTVIHHPKKTYVAESAEFRIE